MALPDTPIVFESGVLRFEDDGTLHVHLSHSADAPHPLIIQPDGDGDTVPVGVSAAVCTGSGDGHFRSQASLLEAEALPEGLVLMFRGYEFVQVEMSGDVSVLMRAPESLPDWFVPGKVHRFDGPEDGVRIWSGSSKPPAPPKPPARPPIPPRRPDPAPSSSSSKSGKSGCALLIGLLAVIPSALWML